MWFLNMVKKLEAGVERLFNASRKYLKAGQKYFRPSWFVKEARERKGFRLFTFVVLSGGAGGFAALMVILLYYNATLPEFEQLLEYKPPITTRVHAGDGRLLAEFAAEKRIFIPIEAVPELVKQAFIAAEDQRFYSHPGIDVFGIMRAIKTDIQVIITGNGQLVGGSTITQQVAKNFLLTNQRTIERKIKEAILSIKIERILTKDDILELYLNEIYLGARAYGVGAAALQYFDKSLEELTLPEVAYLAALPKAPNNYRVDRYPEEAKIRRDWVIRRMRQEKYIPEEEALLAIQIPLLANNEDGTDKASAAYFVEEVRRELSNTYGEEELYQGGLSVRTSLNSELQKAAEQALKKGLYQYDRRHGYRGPVEHFTSDVDLDTYLEETDLPPGAEKHWKLAAVIEMDDKKAKILLRGRIIAELAFNDVRWARRQLADEEVSRGRTIASDLIGEEFISEYKNLLGPPLKRMSDVLTPGDIILVSNKKEGGLKLEQIPEIDGALVSLDPHTGRIYGMVGGWNFNRSEFNRATQAKRQTGSAFKPFVYLSALERGYTPATRILDAPFVASGGENDAVWKPDNFSKKFYGPSPMRVGVVLSRNLMTVRLANAVGMSHIADTANRFGIIEEMPRELVMALGAGETSLLRLTAAYAMLANGGKKITPTMIDRVQDREGETLFRSDKRNCLECNLPVWRPHAAPELIDDREQITDPVNAYQIVSILEDVIRRGTGARVRQKVTHPIAGKTGTTNDSRDVWFVGFTPDLVTGVFVGFDTPRSLGLRGGVAQETASNVAAPIFADFMEVALKEKPHTPFRVPSNVMLVRINAHTGGLSQSGDKKTVLEAFRPGTQPVDATPGVLIGSSGEGGGLQEVGGIDGEESELLEGIY